ncbi:bifunctional DNA primase/polymerase [Nisaea acidiphila]|uniref:Bifunctional DNA primase/polymerase n=1 Tax=Nisaea acidiphila TaxID=1862145 RepID=A0A9J7AXC1_9PROT|nr:bifunctional DNA primase/polymerase [Nisaea acidiphila]UUX50892.1 bifunctional DNA primase/polymerase [Nisaea acidiphila]
MNRQAVLKHALQFADLDMAVFPVSRPIRTAGGWRCGCGRQDCSSPGKHPDGRRAPQGFKDASRDLHLLHEWFPGSDSLNIGIATGAVSSIFVLDIDERHDGFTTLSELEERHGELPPTWRFLTGGGGEHILFRHPGGRVPNSASAIGPGIDVRGDGGYIVAPPSLHVSGRLYTISVDHHPDDVPLSPAPDWLISLVRPSGASKRDTPAHGDWRDLIRTGIPEGSRNQTFARIAGYLIRKSVDPHLCLTVLLGLNTQACKPPLPEEEVLAVLKSILKRHAEKRVLRRGKDRVS